MDKHDYELAEMEIELFALEDVICASHGNSDDDDWDPFGDD